MSESAPYEPMTIARKSGLGWNKGTTVLLLDDVEGNTWIMKGFQQGLAPKYTYEEFVASGQSRFEKLPKGWKFRVKFARRRRRARSRAASGGRDRRPCADARAGRG